MTKRHNFPPLALTTRYLRHATSVSKLNGAATTRIASKLCFPRTCLMPFANLVDKRRPGRPGIDPNDCRRVACEALLGKRSGHARPPSRRWCAVMAQCTALLAE